MSAKNSISIAPYLEVMIADGDGMFCILVDEYLRLLEFEKIYLVTAEELILWKLARRRFDIILLETCREYKTVWQNVIERKYDTSLIIAVTFDKSGRDWLKAMEYGADGVLVKPFTRSRLAETLSALLVSPAARRCKIVPLPGAVQTPSKRDNYIHLL